MSFQSFKSQWIGSRVDYDKVYGFQCVDLIKQYLDQEFGLKPGAWGDAINYWDNTNQAILEKFDKHQDSYVQEGDIVVFKGINGNKAGHIGVATGQYNNDAVEVLEQNGSTGSGDGKGGNVIRTRFIARSRVAGRLQPRVAVMPPQSNYAGLVGKTIKLEPKDGTWKFHDPTTNKVVVDMQDDGKLIYEVRGVNAIRPNQVLVKSAAAGGITSVALANSAGVEYSGEWKII